MASATLYRRLFLLAFSATALAVTAPTRAAGPFQYFTVTPCRIADTRNPNGPNGGPILSKGVVRKFPVQGVCNIPVGAQAVTVNLTAVTPSARGHLILYPSGITTPVVASLNFAGGETAIGNGAIVPLADQGAEPLDLSVYPNGPGPFTVHVVLDVTGYFQ